VWLDGGGVGIHVEVGGQGGVEMFHVVTKRQQSHWPLSHGGATLSLVDFMP